MPLNAKQKAEYIKDAPKIEPPLSNRVTDLSATMQLCLRELGRKFAFKTVECLRSIPRQKWLVAHGKSWTDKSRHILGLAADLYPIPSGYGDPKVFVAMHNDWERIVKAHGRVPEKRIANDMTHFGINP